MTWNSFGILIVLGIIVGHQLPFGAGVLLPAEWSFISSLFDPQDEIYPKSQYYFAIAKAALQGIGGDIKYEDVESAPTPSGTSIKGSYFRWPGYPGNAKIPYFIHPSVRPIKKLIFQAMNQYRRNTCIDFVPRRNQKDYIRFIYGRGCSSYVGRMGGPQDVTLGDGCNYVGTIAHEIGHVVGMHHEHQRSDRDDYLKVFLRNVIPGEEHNFNKIPKREEHLVTPFNYNSIMIYGNFAFSREPKTLETMLLKTKKVLRDPYEKPGLDNTDIREVNRLYECGYTRYKKAKKEVKYRTRKLKSNSNILMQKNKLIKLATLH